MKKQVETAIKNHVVGYVFVGAFGEARKLGYIQGTKEFSQFSQMLYAEFIKYKIGVDKDGKIVHFTPR